MAVPTTTRKLKVYGWTAMVRQAERDLLGLESWHRQARCVVAATSLKEVGELVGRRYSQLHCLALVRQKYQYPHFRQLLKDTEDAELIEGNTWGGPLLGVYRGTSWGSPAGRVAYP